jgi:hypothetical protein
MLKYHQRPEIKERRKQSWKVYKTNNQQRMLAREAQRRLKKRAQCLVANCRTRSRRRGLVFNLDDFIDELQRRIDMGVCEITGCRFDLSPGRKWNSPSIDRINSKLGYTPENVRVVCQAMNLAMADWGEEPVYQMLQTWQSFPKSRRSSSKRT